MIDAEAVEDLKQAAYDAAAQTLKGLHGKITVAESQAITLLMNAMAETMETRRKRIAEFENLTKAIITDDQVIDQYPTNGIAILVPIDKLRPLFEMVIPDGKEG